MGKKKDEKAESITAKAVAEGMAANMTKNMEDPNFEADRERILDEAAKNALKKNEKALKKAGIKIPGQASKKR